MDEASETSTAKDEAHYDSHEIVAVVLLGLATVAIAWGAYQSSLWSGIQSTRLTESILVANESVDSLQEADTILTFDKALFVELVLLAEGGFESEEELDDFRNDGAGGFLLDNMSDAGREATEEWFGNELLLPFDDEEFRLDFYADGIELSELSEDFFAAAGEANKNGDNYVLASTLLAAVLFLVGISTVMRADRTRTLLLAGSTVLFVGSAIFLVNLPKAALVV